MSWHLGQLRCVRFGCLFSLVVFAGVNLGLADSLAQVFVVPTLDCCATAWVGALYRAKTRRHACDLQVRSPAGPVMIMRWPRDSST
jgi:hypothetical protein